MNTLGYGIPTGDDDSVYRLTFQLPHSSSSIIFQFSGIGLQALPDESWGLDNVQVEVVPANTPTPTPQPQLPPPTPTNTPIPLCDPEPRQGCQTANSSSLVIRTGTKMQWKYRGSVSASELGDPVEGTTQYALCVYDEWRGVPALAARAAVEPGGICERERPCWRKRSNKTQFKDRSLTQEGVEQIDLRTNGLLFKVTGSKGLPMPVNSEQFFLQDTQVTVQAVNSEGFCWEAVYENPRRNLPHVYRAK